MRKDNLPDNGEFDVPFNLAAALTNFAHDVTIAMTPCAPSIHTTACHYNKLYIKKPPPSWI